MEGGREDGLQFREGTDKWPVLDDPLHLKVKKIVLLFFTIHIPSFKLIIIFFQKDFELETDFQFEVWIH